MMLYTVLMCYSILIISRLFCVYYYTNRKAPQVSVLSCVYVLVCGGVYEHRLRLM